MVKVYLESSSVSDLDLKPYPDSGTRSAWIRIDFGRLDPDPEGRSDKKIE